MHYIGVDGGGTKTKFTLFDENMEEMDSCVQSTCHFSQVGYKRMEEILKEGLQTLITLHQISDYGIGYGLAGYGQELEIREQIERVVKRVSEGHPYHLGNDVESAIAGALDLQDGIVVIAGTGSISFGIRGEERLRCGGWGYQIGDEGSAWWLGNKTLQLFSQQADGRCDKSVLYDIVMNHLKLSHDYDIISYVRDELQHNRRKIAELALFLHRAALQGDVNAISIYEEAAYEVSRLIETIRKKLFSDSERVPVSYIGGVFKAGKYIIEPLSQKLSSCCILQQPMYGPEKGACLLLKQKQEKQQ